MEDFIGFTYNGKHCIKDFGIYRTSDGSRYNDNLVPSMTDKTADIPGGDGQYFFQTTHKNRQFSVSIAFDHLTEQKYREMRTWLDGKKIHDLIFDEAPYKVYSAKVTGTPQLKTLCFDEDGQRVYKGEGTIQFTCYYPYAHTPNFPDLEEDIEEENVDIKEGKELKCGMVILPGTLFMGMCISGTVDKSSGKGDLTVVYNKSTKDEATGEQITKEDTLSFCRYAAVSLDIKGHYLDNGEPYSNYTKKGYYSYSDVFERPIIIDSIIVRGILCAFPNSEDPTNLNKVTTKTFLFNEFCTTGYSNFSDFISIGKENGDTLTNKNILEHMDRIITYQKNKQSDTRAYRFSTDKCFEQYGTNGTNEVFDVTPSRQRSGKNINHYTITNYPNKSQWALTSGLQEFYKDGDNFGDLPAPFVVTGPVPKNVSRSITVGNCSIIIAPQKEDYQLYWDSKSGLVTKIQDYKKIPIEYTGISYGTIPVGTASEHSPSGLNGLTLDYDYWYY